MTAIRFDCDQYSNRIADQTSTDNTAGVGKTEISIHLSQLACFPGHIGSFTSVNENFFWIFLATSTRLVDSSTGPKF